MRLADAVRRSNRNPLDAARAERQNEEATVITRELGTPWTGVLADLEAASQASAGEIAVLAVEPDHDKHRILIKAEAKTLPLALAYLKRLQQSRSLRFPMLDSHEIAADDKDHPVRFAMWRTGRSAHSRRPGRRLAGHEPDPRPDRAGPRVARRMRSGRG